MSRKQDESSFAAGPSAAPPSPQSQKAPRRKANFEREANWHRMSRFPDRFTAKPSNAQDDPSDLTPFATSYFKNNPDAEDLSTPEEKLERLNAILGSSASSAERFTALSQKKAMVYLIYGDESYEMMTCFRELGAFYSQNDRPDSAIRNFKSAEKLEEKVDVSEEEQLQIAIELAESYLRAPKKRKQYVNSAEVAISKFGDQTCEGEWMLRLALVRARIAKEKERWEEASENYNIAIDNLGGKMDEPAGKVYVEAGEVSETMQNFELALNHYQTAKEVFENSESQEFVEFLESKIQEMEERVAEQQENE